MAEPKASQKLVLKKYALDEISKFKDPQERKNFLNTLSNSKEILKEILYVRISNLGKKEAIF